MSLNLWFLRPASFEVGKFNSGPVVPPEQEPRENEIEVFLLVLPWTWNRRLPAGLIEAYLKSGLVELRAFGAAALDLEEVREGRKGHRGVPDPPGVLASRNTGQDRSEEGGAVEGDHRRSDVLAHQ
jgi:hypothetical protein